MNITVMGAGNGAHALAGDLALRGHSITLWENPLFPQNIEHLRLNGNQIKISGAISGTAQLERVTTDAGLAVADAEIIFVLMPSFGQESAFEHMAPYIHDGQMIFIMPGNFGSISLYSRLKKRGLQDKVIIGESDTIPYATRLTSNHECNVFGVKESMWASAIPAHDTDSLIRKLKDVLPLKLNILPSVIAVALANTNMIIHCPTMIMNAGRIETGARFRFYNDGMSASVCKVMESMDKERLAVANSLGYSLITEFEDALANYSLDGSSYKDLHDVFSSHPVYSKMGIDSPLSVTHRYLTEDVPFLLVPLAEIGRMARIETTTINAIIHLAGIINQTDYITNGRTLKSLGLNNMSLNDIRDFVNG